MNRKSYLGLYFLLSFGITWLFWIPDALGKRGILPNTFWTNLGFLGAFGPLIAAIIVTHKESGKSGLKQLFKKGIDRSFAKKWWIPIIGLFPLLITLGFIIGIAIDGIIPPLEASEVWMYLPFIFFSVMFTSGPFQEEFGWRGYAMPKLLGKKLSLLKSTIILGIIWAIWHIPQFLVPKELTGMFYITPFWSFFFTVLGANFIYSWIYVNTNGSVLASLVLHTQMNLFFWIFPVLNTEYGYIIILANFWVAAIIIIRFGKKKDINWL